MLYLPLTAAAISAIGQVMLKYAMLKHGPIIFNFSGLLSLFGELWLLLALSLYVAAMLMWLQVLSKIPLSAAYPILAVTYIIVPFLSMIFLGERIHQIHAIGMFLILAGVTLIGRAV